MQDVLQIAAKVFNKLPLEFSFQVLNNEHGQTGRFVYHEWLDPFFSFSFGSVLACLVVLQKTEKWALHFWRHPPFVLENKWKPLFLGDVFVVIVWVWNMGVWYSGDNLKAAWNIWQFLGSKGEHKIKSFLQCYHLTPWKMSLLIL